MSEEKTLFQGSPSLLTRFGGLFLCFLIIAGCATGAVLMKDPPAARWILSGIAAVCAIYALAVIIVVKATRYEVTSQRIRVRRGILTKRLDELELYRANDTSLIEPLSLRMFGLGTIEVRTVDATTPTTYLEAIHGARDVREKLRIAIEECRDRKGVRLTEFENPGPTDPTT
jgi:uncharacterized membrane protein YdbT with pleckstrin-like domain